MYHIKCTGCGQNIELKDFLTAASTKCENCGRSVMSCTPAPPTRQEMVEGPPPSPYLQPPPDRRPTLIGALVGAILGAGAVMMVGYLGGRFAPPFIGAIGGATLFTLIVFFRAGGLDVVATGLVTGNYHGMNLWMVALLVLGGAIGMGIGLTFEEVYAEIVVVAAFGGLLIGALLGAVLGPAWANLDKPKEVAELR